MYCSANMDDALDSLEANGINKCFEYIGNGNFVAARKWLDGGQCDTIS